MTVRLSLCLLLFAVLFAGMGNAQTPPAEPKLAVEIPGLEGFPPTYATLAHDGTSSLLYDGSLRRLAGADPTKRQPSALKLDYKMEGGLVRITASVFFGDFDRRSTPTSLTNLPREEVGSYTAGLNASVTLAAMERFGLEPLTLKIVTAQPASSARPQTMSKAPSIQIEIVGEDRTFYSVALHNLSAKPVKAYCVDMPQGDDNQSQSSDGQSKDLIAPGATYQLRFSIPHSGRRSSGTFVESPPPPYLVLEAVLFSGGTYEGDAPAAARLVAHRAGAQIQLERVDKLVAAIFADPQSDDTAKLARIRSEVAQLTEEPDQPMIESVCSGFPGLTDQAVEAVKRGLRTGLNAAKQSVDRGLRDFEHNQPKPGGLTLADWWARWRKA